MPKILQYLNFVQKKHKIENLFEQEFYLIKANTKNSILNGGKKTNTENI
jgi:hypothetical protein